MRSQLGYWHPGTDHGASTVDPHGQQAPKFQVEQGTKH